MKVKNVLSLAAELVGLDDTITYLESGVSDDAPSREEEIKKLLAAYNMALVDAATDFAPLVKKKVTENAEEILFSALSDIPVEIISVTDANGDELPYIADMTGVHLKKTAATAVVEYRYVPDRRSADDDLDYGFADRITPRALSLGTAAEYLRCAGESSKANEFRAKFEESLRACLRPRGKLVLPGRRWV